MTVGELLERISSRELTEWMAYFSIEGPTGDERADWRAGMVASMIANVNRDAKKRHEPYRPEDFMPKFERQESDSEPVDAAYNPGLAGYVRQLQRQLGGRLTIGEQDTGPGRDDYVETQEAHQADLVIEIARRANEMIRADLAVEDDDFGPGSPGWEP